MGPRDRRRNAPVLSRKVAVPTTAACNQGTGTLSLFSSHGFPDFIPGLQVKKSKRWATEQVPSGAYKLPYISKCGKFTGVSLGTFSSTPTQVVATIMATILSRARHWVYNHNSYSAVVKHRRLIIRSAYYYAVSHNSWFWDRFLFLSKEIEKNKNIICALSLRFMSKLDDYNRFVYSQVCVQTNWLLFRGRYPSDRRDKSHYGKASSSKSFRLGIFFRRGLEWLQGRAFLHVASDMLSLYGPAYLSSTHRSLVPGAVCKARCLTGPPSN